MSGWQIIEEYLVALGADVNNKEFADLNRVLNSAKNEVNKFSSAQDAVSKSTLTMVRNLAIVPAALMAVAGATVKLIDNVAKSDVEYQKMAKDLWITKQNAKELSMTLDTMGENMNDVAWVPELREQFYRLRQEMQQLQTPGDANGQLRYIRTLNYEFQSFMLKVRMLREWVAYYLIKYLNGPLAKIGENLKKINSSFGTNIAAWGQKIAGFLATIISLASSVFRLFTDIFGGVQRFFDSLPDNVRKMVVVLTAAGALLLSGPIGMMIAGVSMAILLLEDFYAYVDGRKSSKTFAPLWKFLTDDNNEASGTLTNIKNAIKDTLELLTKIVTGVFDEKTRNHLAGTVKSIAKGVISIAKGLSDIFSLITKNTNEADSFWAAFNRNVKDAVMNVSILGRVLGNLMDGMGKLLSGDVKGAKLAFIKAGFSAMDYFANRFAPKKGSGSDKDVSFEAFAKSIASQESGGDYGAENERTGAFGKYQILPENWSSWSREALGYVGDMTDSDTYEQVALFKLRQYYDKYGARGAAIAWYGGEGALDYSDYDMNKKQGNGNEPSINEYANDVVARAGGYRNMSTAGLSATPNYLSNAYSWQQPFATANNSYGGGGISIGQIIIQVPGGGALSANDIAVAVRMELQKLKDQQSYDTAVQIRATQGVQL